MKAYHYLLLIAAVLGIWYYIGWKKEKSVKTSKEDKTNEPGKPAITPKKDKDTSENADVATVTKNEALAIAAKGYEDLSLSQDMGDAPEYKWTLGYSDEDGEWHNEILSKDTFDALVAAGYEPDYN